MDDGDARARLQARLDDSDFHTARGFTLEAVGDGRAVLAMPHKADLTNFSGALHGGAIASLVDTASALAIRSSVADPLAPELATTDLTVTYVRPARSDARAEATVDRIGGSLAVVRVEVTSVAPDGNRKIVATGRTTYRVMDAAGQPTSEEA